METHRSSYRQVIVTGPESTGKTELSKQLASKYKCSWIPELSRSYVENLGRRYSYEDVTTIASKQIAQFEKIYRRNEAAIFDTGLIITKVWFDVVYEKCPAFVIDFIQQQPKVFHLLCATDIPWKADSVRENGGEMREELFDIYVDELEKYKFPFQTVYGLGEERLRNAANILDALNIL